MNRLKKFWIVFLSFLPFGAGALPQVILGALAVIGVTAGFSIYRSMAPVNMADSVKFFSSCWSCQMFSDILSTMSGLLVRAFSALGSTVVTVAVMLTVIWFAWTLLSGFFNSNIDKPWDMTSKFGVHILKLGFVCMLLVAPLPRIISNTMIEPIFNVGLTLNRMAVHDDSFDECVVASAIADPVTDKRQLDFGAFSPKLRHNLTCELAGIHQMTGLGMAIGWTMLQMSFDWDYNYKILWALPISPNIFMFAIGILLIGLFFAALIPIPLYLLEVFIKLSMDLIMLPLMLLAWLFKGWKISLEGVGTSLKSMIDNVISATLGIAMTGIFISFSVMFLNAVFGNWGGSNTLEAALNANDSDLLMESLLFKDDTLITIFLMGLFMTMFMIMIPALIKALFNVQISEDFYKKAKSDLDNAWSAGKKWWENIKK